MSTPIFNVFIIDNGLIIESPIVFLTLRDTVIPYTYYVFYACHESFWIVATFGIDISSWCTMIHGPLNNTTLKNVSAKLIYLPRGKL